MRKALLMVLLMLPLAAAQTQVLSDDEGDATARVGPQDSGIDTSSLDLVEATVQEEAEAFFFSVRLGDIDPENPTQTDSGTVDLDFTHGDQGYRLRFIRDTTTGANRFFGQFLAYEAGRGNYVYRENMQPDISTEEETFTFEVPRDWILDSNGTAPTVGRSLDLFRGFARNNNPGFTNALPTGVQIRDAMPDSGYGDIPYEILMGLQQTGHAFLESETPVRASNGEKGTFVYYVDASNLGEDEDHFALSVKEVPDLWDVTLPGATIRLDGNDTRTFPVLVTVPFAHQHGAFENFILEMKSQTDNSAVGRLEIGIRYLETPQPAGHHDRLHIHTQSDETGATVNFDRSSGPRAFFNTLEEDDNDDDAAVPPKGGFFEGGRQRLEWDLYLEPGLQMGLDFDRNRTGEITVDFETDLDMYSASFSGYLVHLAGELQNGQLRDVEETVLATIPPTSPQNLGDTTSFDAIIQPTKASDRIPFTKNAAMQLRLNLTFDDNVNFGGTETDPALIGGQFTLPLNEYRDDIQGVFNSLAGLDFDHAGDPERPVNPGETVLFNLTLTNDGAVDDVFTLRVNGTNVEWARLLGDQEIFVPTGTSRPVVVAVSPPDDAPHLDVADLIVTAASKAEPTVQGNIRVVAVIDDVLDHPDEAHLVEALDKDLTKGKKSPAAPLLLVCLALLAVAARRRP